MKIIFSLLMTICLCAGCKKNDNEPTIIGKWQVLSIGPPAIKNSDGLWMDNNNKPYESTTISPYIPGQPCIYEFKNDMSFTFTWSQPAGSHLPQSGVYTYANNTLVLPGKLTCDVEINSNNNTMVFWMNTYTNNNSGSGLFHQKNPWRLKRIK